MTIVSGIQPSGKLHVGNALGAVRKWLELQDGTATIPHPPSPPLPAGGGGNTCFFFIADWHSLTEQYDPAGKAAQVRELAAELLALGVGAQDTPSNSPPGSGGGTGSVALFRQSDIPEHLELAWYFACLTPMAELQRMTQYKDKTGHGESTNVGLFTYPVLMAADILAYNGKQGAGGIGVPVGDDQRQHLELANNAARWFNNRYGETFSEVRGLHTVTARIMSLKDPSRKMSKSAGADHCLFLDDAPEVVERKLRAAVTDTTPSSSPPGSGGVISAGVQTLFTILETYGDAGAVADFRAQHADGTIKYSALKLAVAHAFSDAHTEFRAKKAELLAHPDTIDRALAHGAEQARAVAQQTLTAVRQSVGIR